jgi:hypothetical protein
LAIDTAGWSSGAIVAREFVYCQSLANLKL